MLSTCYVRIYSIYRKYTINKYKCRQHVHREILIRVTILYYLYSPETILPSAINALLHQSQFFFQQTSKLQLPKQWRTQHRIKKAQITVTESHMVRRAGD